MKLRRIFKKGRSRLLEASGKPITSPLTKASKEDKSSQKNPFKRRFLTKYFERENSENAPILCPREKPAYTYECVKCVIKQLISICFARRLQGRVVVIVVNIRPRCLVHLEQTTCSCPCFHCSRSFPSYQSIE